MYKRQSSLWSPAALWDASRAGSIAVGHVPLARWDRHAVELHKALPAKASKTTQYGAFLSLGPDVFDAELFRMKPVDVANCDPQQRLLLEVGFEACAAGGLDSLQDADVGTFTGLMNSDAIALAPDAHDLNAYVMMGNGYSAAGARLSYAFALRGPCLVLDTACSSSLIACHTGRRSLQHDECALALVAAPNHRAVLLRAPSVESLVRFRANPKAALDVDRLVQKPLLDRAAAKFDVLERTLAPRVTAEEEPPVSYTHLTLPTKA